MSKANTKEQEPKEQKSMAREILEMVFYLVIALLAALFIVNFVGQRTQVDGHSMDPTLADGQNLILDKVSYRFRDPERYDIIVFPFEENRTRARMLSTSSVAAPTITHSRIHAIRLSEISPEEWESRCFLRSASNLL